MSSAAMRAAEEADAVLATTLGKTKLLTAVKKLELLSELEFEHEHDACEQSLLASVQNAEKVAAGELGDRVKFAAAAKQQERRWRLFLAVLDVSEACEPTVELMEKYAAFMYTSRARQSSSGRLGLGDAVCKMAQYTLAQVRETSCGGRACNPDAARAFRVCALR